MKKHFAVAILGLAALGLSAGQAKASWFHCFCCKQKCCLTLSARQYNAFSPYCLDNLQGCLPVQGLAQASGCCSGPASCFPGNAGYLGQLPAPGEYGPHGAVAMPGTQMYSAPLQGGDNGQAGAAPQAWPQPSPSALLNPTGAPGSYPGLIR